MYLSLLSQKGIQGLAQDYDSRAALSNTQYNGFLGRSSANDGTRPQRQLEIDQPHIFNLRLPVHWSPLSYDSEVLLTSGTS